MTSNASISLIWSRGCDRTSKVNFWLNWPRGCHMTSKANILLINLKTVTGHKCFDVFRERGKREGRYFLRIHHAAKTNQTYSDTRSRCHGSRGRVRGFLLDSQIIYFVVSLDAFAGVKWRHDCFKFVVQYFSIMSGEHNWHKYRSIQLTLVYLVH